MVQSVRDNRIGFIAAIMLAITLAVPAGAHVFYSRADGTDRTVWIAAEDGSFDQPLTQGSWPRVSRDGRSMVFLRGYNPDISRGSLYVRDLAAGTERLVFSNTGQVFGYDFSPDGTRILLDSECGLYEMNADGSGLRPLSSADCADDAPQWNPAGTAFAFHNTHAGLYLEDAGGANRRVIPNTVSGDVWPAWSRDGAWIAFLSGGDLYKIRPDGTQRTRLTAHSPGDAFGPARDWTPDNVRLIAPGTVNGEVGLFSVPVSGSGPVTPVPTKAGDAADFTSNVIDLPDTDHDGVPDILDACPGTLVGTPVNGAGCPVGNCFTPLPGMLAWWRANGGTDDSLGAKNATAQGVVSLAAGMVGQAFSVGAPDAHLEVADTPFLRPASLSIEGWFLFGSAPAGTETLFGKAVGTCVVNTYVVQWRDGALRASAGGPNGSGPELSYPWTPVPGTWHHVAFTMDGIARYGALYLDGVLRAAFAEEVPMVYDAHPLTIGADYSTDSPAEFFTGLIDEVSLYNRPLSSREVAAIYQAGAAGKCATTVPFYRILRVVAGIETAQPGDLPTYDTDGDKRLTLTDVARLIR